MPNTFEELMQTMADAGVAPDFIDQIRTVTAASPLRKEIGDLTKERDDLRTQVGKHRDATLAAKFEALGVTVKPDALRIPDDLDPLDGQKVTDWLVGMGLAEPPPPSEEDQQRNEDLEAERRVAGASSGAGAGPGGGATLTPEIAAEWPIDKTMRFKKQYPDEFEALKRGESVRNTQFA